MVYQEDPSMLLLVLDALDSVVLVGTVGSVEASSEKDMEEPGMEDLRAVEEVWVGTANTTAEIEVIAAIITEEE